MFNTQRTASASNYEETLKNLKKVFTSEELEKSLLNKTLLIELKYLQKFCPNGVYIIPQSDNIQIWHGVVFVREGFYKEGIFKFRIEIPISYPKNAPSVIFFSKVYHPLINGNTGKLDLSKKFPVWTPGKCFLVKVIYYIQDIFYNEIIIKNNKAKLSGEELDKINDSVQRSREDKYKNDEKSSIKFSPPTKFHQLILDKILKQNKDLSTYDRIEDFKNWFMNNFMEIVQNNDKQNN